jgi:hypothetical protein
MPPVTHMTILSPTVSFTDNYSRRLCSLPYPVLRRIGIGHSIEKETVRGRKPPVDQTSCFRDAEFDMDQDTKLEIVVLTLSALVV